MRRFLAALAVACVMTGSGVVSAAPFAAPFTSAGNVYEARAVWATKLPGPKQKFDIYWAYGAQTPREDGSLLRYGGMGHTRCFSKDLFLIFFFCKPGGSIKELPDGAFTIDPALGSASLTITDERGTGTAEWSATGLPSDTHYASTGDDCCGTYFSANNYTIRPADALGDLFGVDPGTATDIYEGRLMLYVGANVYNEDEERRAYPLL